MIERDDIYSFKIVNNGLITSSGNMSKSSGLIQLYPRSHLTVEEWREFSRSVEEMIAVANQKEELVAA